MTMTSSRPYMVRALYDWIVENECTPHLLVDSHWPGVHLPDRFAEEDQVVLNISPTAIRELDMANDAISFKTRFGGIAYHVYVPVSGVMAIYARENGQGMVFEMEAYPEAEPASEAPQEPVIKPVSSLKSVSSSPSDDDKNPPPPKGGSRPSLKVIK